MPASSLDRKSYVIDTSVLAYCGESIHSFDNSTVYIPIEVLEEVDNLKTRRDSAGINCRYVNRYLDKLRENGNLASGVDIENGQKIIVATFSDIGLLSGKVQDNVDNRIISVALKLQSIGASVSVVSRDISLRVKCDGLGVRAEDFSKNKTESEDTAYGDMINIEAADFEIDDFYSKGYVVIPGYDFHPNQGVVLTCGRKSALAIATNSETLRRFSFVDDKGFGVEGVFPRTKEQHLALEMLLDPDIHMVSLSGIAGSGKTLIAIAAAMNMLNGKIYKKLVITRPTHSTSKEIGFLPGDLKEKMMPWVQPIFDNLNVLYKEKGNQYINMMIDRGTIEIAALSYIRGRTLPDTIFIIDEAQNITHHEAKALITRMGENSKIILIGDLDQIDSNSINHETSGLTSVAELFKDFEYSGHVRLRKGERSKLATFAAKVM